MSVTVYAQPTTGNAQPTTWREKAGSLMSAAKSKAADAHDKLRDRYCTPALELLFNKLLRAVRQMPVEDGKQVLSVAYLQDMHDKLVAGTGLIRACDKIEVQLFAKLIESANMNGGIDADKITAVRNQYRRRHQ
jgi:hypothetical protein